METGNEILYDNRKGKVVSSSERLEEVVGILLISLPFFYTCFQDRNKHSMWQGTFQNKCRNFY